MSWPKGIDPENNGRIERQPGHLIDLMSTCPMPRREASAAWRTGHPTAEGVSLLPAFRGGDLRKDALYFDHHLNGAVRDGKWKLVRYGDWSKCEITPLAALRHGERSQRAN